MGGLRIQQNMLRYTYKGDSQVAQWKNPPDNQKMWVKSVGGIESIPWSQESALEKEMATHSNIFSWEIPWTEEPGRL